MKENLLNRKTYKEIKKMDRQQMEDFLAKVYVQGYEDGKEAVEKVDLEINLVEFLENTSIPGIGEKTKEKIINALRERRKKQGVIN